MWRRVSQAAVSAAGEPQARPLPARAPAGRPAAPGSTAPAFPLAPRAGSAAPGAADAPTAARLLGAERRMEDGLTIPLAAGAPLEAVGGTAGPGTAPRISAEHMAAAGTLITAPVSGVPPSRQTPGRKIRPRLPPGAAIPTPLRRILHVAAGGPSKPGKALCLPAPGTPTAMCRMALRRADRAHRGRTGHPLLSGLTLPAPTGQEPRPREAAPVPAPQAQEQRRKSRRRNSRTRHSPVPQEQRRPASLPAPPTAPVIPRAAVR